MLSLNAPCIPWAWSAFMQCHYKTLVKLKEKMCVDASISKWTDRETDASLSFQHIKIQQSLIDRLIPAIAKLEGPNSHLRIEALTPRTFASSLLQASSSAHFQYTSVRNFRTKASHSKIELEQLPQEKLIEDMVKNTTKSLDLNTREAMSFTLGLKEGVSLKPPNEESGSFKWRRVGSIFFVGIVAYTIYNLLMSNDLNKSEGFDGASGKKDYRAEIPDVSFDDVKGIDEVKNELKDVVEFLRDPDRFTDLGGKLPKGLLLVGPPGTGKTLLAKAIAGEADVPFYFASGSEFDEVFVGVGSARIRKLFAEARENAPCIIFIDEIDACGSTRTSSPIQPYARQTINQLLQEMDGYSESEGVIVLAATNMSDALDKALTRPGRFDTQINILPPDIKGRKEILELYSSRIVHGDDLDLDKIACLTGGMTGAALSNLVNQAALRAAQQNKSYAEQSDFEFALDKLHLGPELKTRVRTEAELELTAYHEAGHALVAYYSPNTPSIYKATIGQRGPALGHVSYIQTEEDETGSTKAKLLAMIDVAMGGRVAEEILKGSDHVTTGASSDLKQATNIAYQVVCSMGMSEKLGFMQYSYKHSSPETKLKIEAEVNEILKTSYAKSKDLLTKHSHQHKLLAKGLLKYETLTLEEIKTLLSTQNIKSVEKMRNQTLSQNVPENSELKPGTDSIPSPM
uniref:ATP-dependent zinc metalloprotease YME1L1-like n=1 Tax=Styela clava TaxID=7725 RepID=UPI001939CAF7|nr:ATP-dependent zinc metalloprotease YME1L1-like [Styela clava]